MQWTAARAPLLLALRRCSTSRPAEQRAAAGALIPAVGGDSARALCSVCARVLHTVVLLHEQEVWPALGARQTEGVAIKSECSVLFCGLGADATVGESSYAHTLLCACSRRVVGQVGLFSRRCVPPRVRATM